jgi:chitinase
LSTAAQLSGSSSGSGSGGTGTGSGGSGSNGSGSGTSTAPASFVFSPYKDITISANWNTDVISSAVTGTMESVTTVMPSNLSTLTWAFATGECGSETWGGLTPASVAAANVQSFASAGKKYILSTGGADGVFTCGTDAGFATFIQTYYSSNLVGVDFDIEAGQTTADIAALVARVKTAQATYPNLRFSFTVATLGGNASPSLGTMGIEVMSAIQSAGLTNYFINLMAMDYGSAIASNCTVVNGVCEMGQSAVAAAESLHSYYGVPYSQIELTPATRVLRETRWRLVLPAGFLCASN